MTKINNIVDILKTTKSALIVSHRNPDGDTLGAAFALYTFLSKRIECSVFCKDVVPPQFSFIHGSENVMHELPEVLPETVIVVDCGSLDRMGDAQSLSGKIPLVNIDHHGTNNNFGDVNYVDSTASSTCEIIYEMLSRIEGSITPKVADCLYTGIITDTGRFGFDYTTPHSLRACAALMEKGADFNYIHKKIYRTRRLQKVKLQGATLSTLQIYDDVIGMIYIDRDMYEKTGALTSDSEGIINSIIEIESIKVAVIISHFAGNRCKISMRSKDEVHVNEVAEKLGGGGHAKAAGCVLEHNLIDTKKILLKEIREII